MPNDRIVARNVNNEDEWKQQHDYWIFKIATEKRLRKKKEQKRKPDQLWFSIERNDEKKKRQKHNSQKITRNKNDSSKEEEGKKQIRKFILIFLPLTFSTFVSLSKRTLHCNSSSVSSKSMWIYRIHLFHVVRRTRSEQKKKFNFHFSQSLATADCWLLTNADDYILSIIAFFVGAANLLHIHFGIFNGNRIDWNEQNKFHARNS